MPKTDNVGHGQFTSLKMEILRKIFDMHLIITQAVLRRQSFFRQSYEYIDVTAGKGYVPDSTTLGSPLVFLGAIHSGIFQKPFEAHFIELEKLNFQELVKNVQAYSKQNGWDIENYVQFHSGDYQQIIPNLLGSVNKQELGLVFIDHSGDLPNFETINYVTNIRPRMEILIYLSARNIKRIHHLTGKSLFDNMQEISKNFWLIRKPVRWDNLEWTFLLGSNSDIFIKWIRKSRHENGHN
jgi:three-Cys-motif partner protein